MIQHYSSRYVYRAISMGDTPATGAETILSAGKSYVFYGCVYTGGNSSIWFTDFDGNLLWGINHAAQNPTPFTDLRFVGANGLIANWGNQGFAVTSHLTVYLSDTGEGVPS